MMVSRHPGAPCGLGIGTFFCSRLECCKPPGSKAEIVKLKELPNDGFETSRGALWLGIGTLFGSELEYHKPPGPGPKSSV